MIKTHKSKIISIFIGMLFLVIINSTNFSNNPLTNNNAHDKNEMNLKRAGYWEIAHIYIDDTDSSYNWSITEATYDWCRGSGTWNEPYVIENVTIDGNGKEGIEIRNSKVSFIIQNCTIFNYTNGVYAIKMLNVNNSQILKNNLSENYAGMELENCNNNTISENSILTNPKYSAHGHLVLLRDCNNNEILNNLINNSNNIGVGLSGDCDKNIILENSINNTAYAIYLVGTSGKVCDDNIIEKNDLFNNRHLIYLDFVDNCTVFSNNLTKKGGYGIRVGTIFNCNFTNNILEGCGFSILNSIDSTNSIDKTNLINNKFLYYYREINGLNKNNFTNATQIFLDGCNNSIISDFDSSYSSIGIRLINCKNVSILNNNISHNVYGLYSNYGNNCTIYENNVSDNAYGIYFDPDKNSNHSISKNIINGNSRGISVNGENNTIFDNKIVDNTQIGISCTSHANYNLIYNNSFIGNTLNAEDAGTSNYWDNGVIGNYWDDYYGEDANNNGIGDTPYSIAGSAGSRDNYPIWWDVVAISIKSPNSNDFFNTTAPNFTITVDKGLVHTSWYTIDNGLTNITFTGTTGNVSQLEWDKISDDLITLTFYANNTLGVINSSQVLIFKDTNTPTVVINTPTPNELFGTIVPDFNVEIYDANLDTMWYTINGGILKYFFLTNTSFNSVAWDALSDGNVSIKFYANDTVGNINYEEIVIQKDTITPSITINSPNGNDLFGSNAPDYDLTIIDANLDSIWYTLDGGATNSSFINDSGTINQAAWDLQGNGTVLIRFYANDSIGNVGYLEVIVRKDILAPIITINTPTTNQLFGIGAPSYTLTIIEGNLDKMWYALDNGINNITITELTGMINQDLWEKMPNGYITIKFYVNDTLGNLSFQEVTVVKDISQPSPPGIYGYNILLLLGIVSTIAVIIAKKRLNHLN